MTQKKQKFTKYDELLLLFEDYRDQFTLVVVLNLIPIILTSKLDDYFKTIYLESRFQDIFNILSLQNSLVDFCQVLFYTYIGALLLHLAGTKIKVNWWYDLNTILLFIISTYFWSIPTIDSILSVFTSKHYIFCLVIFMQFFFYFIAFRRFIFFIKKIGNKPKINHS